MGHNHLVKLYKGLLVLSTSLTRLVLGLEIGPPRPARSWLSLTLLGALFIKMATGVSPCKSQLQTQSCLERWSYSGRQARHNELSGDIITIPQTVELIWYQF